MPTIQPLSPREEQVLALVARGRSNTEIAAELGITFATAKTHVEHILTKLDVASREEAAKWWEAQRSTGSPSVFTRWMRGIARVPWVRVGTATGVAALVLVATTLAVMLLVALPDGDETAADNGAVPAPTGPPRSSGTTLIYAKRMVSPGSTWQVVAYDMEAGVPLESTEYHPSVLARLFDRAVFIHETERGMGRIFRYLPDGTATTIYESPEGWSANYFAVSPDGAKLAVTESLPGGMYGGPHYLRIFEIETGRELLTVSNDDPRTQPLMEVAHFETPSWAADSTSLIVAAGVNTINVGLLSVTLDGEVRPLTLPGDASPSASPSGAYIAYITRFGGDTWSCWDRQPLGVEIRSQAGTSLLPPLVRDGYFLVEPIWSPDETELLFGWFPAPEAGCPQGDPRHAPETEWMVFSTGDGSLTPVASPNAVRADWFGDNRVEFTCDGAAFVAVPGDARRTYYACGDGAPYDLTLRHGGHEIDRADELIVLAQVASDGTIAMFTEVPWGLSQATNQPGY